MNKRQIRKPLLYLFFLCLTAMACYGYFVEPSRIDVKRIVIRDDALHQAWGEIKIVQLSDLHITVFGKREAEILQRLTEIRPDLVVVTGDWVQWNRDPAAALQFLERLRAPLGVYGILGDADLAAGRRTCFFCHPGGDVHRLRQQPKILKNGVEEIALPAPGKKLRIAGILPQETADTGLTVLLENWQQTNEPLLFLGHFSAGWQEVKNDAPLLWLAGDTHGGQIALPDRIWQKFHLVDYPQYMAGLFADGRHKWLYVNRGLGTVSYFPFRIGVPPEITVITFGKAADQEGGNGAYP